MSLKQKIDESIEILNLASEMSLEYYQKPLVVCISGGKDSDVLLDLAIKSGIPFEALHSITTVDAPETNAHVNRTFKRLKEMGIKCEKHVPTYKGEKTNMWKLIELKGPPTRRIRFCCTVLKEGSTPDRFAALGVRSGESMGRKDRTAFEVLGNSKKNAMHYSTEHIEEVFAESHTMPEAYDCQFIANAKKNKDLVCNPIIDWTESDIWNYVRENNITLNPIYERGETRCGCIGCPMVSGKKRYKAFALYPTYEANYKRAFGRFLERRKREGHQNNSKWKDAESLFRWWMEDDTSPGQYEMQFDDEKPTGYKEYLGDDGIVFRDF